MKSEISFARVLKSSIARANAPLICIFMVIYWLYAYLTMDQLTLSGVVSHLKDIMGYLRKFLKNWMCPELQNNWMCPELQIITKFISYQLVPNLRHRLCNEEFFEFIGQIDDNSFHRVPFNKQLLIPTI